MTIRVIGLDIAKHSFQVHAVDEAGRPVACKKLRRSQVISFFQDLPGCLVGIEACASAHHWARELKRLGHDVRLIPPTYVKPFVRRGAKNDASDAAAICEAVSRPAMRFVPIKSQEQQGFLMLHKVRSLLVRQRTMAVCAFRAHMAEFGIIVGQGRQRIFGLIEQMHELEGDGLPAEAQQALLMLADEIRCLDQRISRIEDQLTQIYATHPMCRLLSSVPGIGPITATALVATLGDASAFGSGRELAAWLGLTPRQSSTGGKTRLGRITKQGNPYLRHLLVMGARNVVRYPKARQKLGGGWIDGLLGRKRPMIVAVAVANKLARIIWAMMTSGECYRMRNAASA